MSFQCQAGQGTSQTEVTSRAVRFLCLLKDLSAMNLCNLYLILSVFLASTPQRLGSGLYFIKLCMEGKCLSSASKL